MDSNDLTKAINNELLLYSREITEKIKEAVPKYSKLAVDKLKTAGTFKNLTGKYRKSWTTSKIEDTANSSVFVIYNKKYQLTHLLENGTKRAQAYPHIEPVEKEIIEEFEKEVEEIIKNDG